MNKQTCTTMFLVPGLGLNLAYIREHGFINAYLKDKDHSDYKDCVYMLYKPSDLKIFSNFLTDEYNRSGAYIIDEYDYTGGYVVLVYKIPDFMKVDYRNFLRGRYSKFTKRFVSLMPQERSGLDEDNKPFVEPSLQIRICTLSKALKTYREKTLDVVIEEGEELWEKPGAREVLNIQNILNDANTNN